MQRVALVDDDRNILASLSVMLESEGYEVDTYSDPELALREVTRRPPDVAVLDVKMPRMDGFDLLRSIRLRSQMPVVMLSSVSDETDMVMGLRLGADDYVTKPFSPRVLLERLRACSRRAERDMTLHGAEAPSRRLECGPLVMNDECHSATWGGKPLRLTRNEFQVLHFLAERPGYVRSRQQILDLLHGDDLEVDDRTIDTQIKRLRTKLRAVDPEFEAIDTVYGVGYRFMAPITA
ncbi:response regulator transcription factor [Palleronia sp. KMU-117]|uniref:response regulator transcription factor n=1 Tax=Palleronia sp. KMU-117 TaxID=3434108 RepID=UPI003D7109CF